MHLARMRRLGVLTACHCLFSFAAYGQDYRSEFPQVEISFGYSYLHNDTQRVNTTLLSQQCAGEFVGGCPFTIEKHPGFNGWILAPQFNFTHWLGIKAQISGQYGTFLKFKSTSTPPTVGFPKLHAYDVLCGAVVSRRARKYTLFAHGLFGLENFGLAYSQINSASLTSYPGVSTSDVAFVIGGGADLKLWRLFSVRVAQLEYQFVNTSNQAHLNDFRYSSGIVIAIGKGNNDCSPWCKGEFTSAALSRGGPPATWNGENP